MTAAEVEEQVRLPAFLGDPAGILRRRGRWMALACLLGVVASTALALSRTPTYRAEASVLVTSQQIKEAFVQPTLEEDSLARINAVVGEVLSRERLIELIEKHDLYPQLRDRLAPSELAAAMRARIAIEPEHSATRYDAARLLRISFEYREPERVAAVVNDLATTFTEASSAARNEQAKLTTDFLRRELEEAERELREQTGRITEFRERYRGELPGEFAANMAKLERLQQTRQALSLQLADAETRFAMISAEVMSGGEDATPEARLRMLEAQLEQQLGVHTERHPEIRALRQQIDSLRASLYGADAREQPGSYTALSAAARRSRDELEAQLRATDREIAALDQRVANTPARQETLAALEEREQVLRDSYIEFLRKVQDSELAQNLESAQQGTRFSIVDRASTPTAPTRARWKILAAGWVASLLLGVGVGLVLEALDPVLITREQVAELSGLPVLGSAPDLRG